MRWLQPWEKELLKQRRYHPLVVNNRDLKGTNEKDRDLPSTQTATTGSSVVIGQRFEGNMSLQLQAPEYPTDFPVEKELVGTGLSCLGKARPSFFPVSRLSTVWTGSWH